MVKKHSFKIVCIILFVLMMINIPMKQALVFQYQNTDELLAYLPIQEEIVFHLKYTHSIHLSDVVESFRLRENGQILLEEFMYDDFAIGMPSNALEGEVFEEKNGKYFIKNMNRKFDYLDLRVGQVNANHTILYENKQYPLANYITPGTWIRIHIKKLSILQLWKGVNINE